MKKRTIELISVYHPDSGKADNEISAFYKHLKKYLDKTRKDNNTIIIGSDANCPLGVANEDDMTLTTYQS